MARIVCFSDDTTVAAAIRQGIGGGSHEVYVLPAALLSNALREKVRDLAPEVVVMDLSPSLDNLHLYIFLRSDAATRRTPVILLSPTERHQQHAAMLGADGLLLRSFLTEQILPTLSPHFLQERAMAA